MKVQEVTLTVSAPLFGLLLVAGVGIVSCPSATLAGEFYNALNLEGTTGLLKTPNVEVIDDGAGSVIYSNQREISLRTRGTREDNYLFAVAPLPFAEIVGRVTDGGNGGPRDLSANVKLKLLPDFAIGVQDIGGGAQYFRSAYAVATETWGNVRMSLGYGTGPLALKGFFGGVELKTNDWLTLIADNDSIETNAGLRVVTPSLFGWPLQVQFTAKTSLDYRPGNMEYGIGFQVPLGKVHEHKNTALFQPVATTPPLPERTPAVATLDSSPAYLAEKLPVPTTRLPPDIIERPLAAPQGSRGVGQPVAPDSALPLLFDKLLGDGFQNVRIGIKDKNTLVVEYENQRYHNNELDGLGVVIGMVVDTVPKGFTTLRILLKKENIPILQIAAPLESFRTFFHDPVTSGTLIRHLSISKTASSDEADMDIVAGVGNPSRFTSVLVAAPGLTTGLATDVGTFDYLLSAQIDYLVNAWRGAILDAGWIVPLTWNKHFDDGEALRNQRSGKRLDRLMLFQSLAAAPSIMVNLGAGLMQPNTYGEINEIMWTPGDGTHRFSFKQAYAVDRSPSAMFRKHEMYLGSYRYYFSPLDISLKATAGRFIENDTGYTLEMQRFFGDTAVSAYYTNSNTINQQPFFPPMHVRVVGLSIALPLTPRRDMKPGLFQVRGADEWGYAQQSTLASSGGANYTYLGYVGNNLSYPINLARVFYNRDRLNEPYIRKHILRLRDAYITYLHQDSVADNGQ